MDPRDALVRAFVTGHFWQADPTLSLDDVLKLDVNHPLAQQAWKSWRNADANFDLILQSIHGPNRVLQDDEWGPATEALVELPRCPLPDHAPPDGADFAGLNYDQAHVFETYREWAKSGTGSWPNCDPNHNGNHSIRINLDMSGASSGWRRDIDYVIANVRSMYAQYGFAIRYVKDGVPRESEIEKQFIRIPGGVIGWNHFPLPNTCNQTISGRLDNDYGSAPRKMKGRLEAHETGHGVGFEHTRGGLMNPTILDGPFSFDGDPHERTAVRYWGGEPITIGDDPPPPPGPGAPIIEDLVIHSADGNTFVFECTLKGSDDGLPPPVVFE